MHFQHTFAASLLFLLGLVGIASANTSCHDETFVPDAVLRITAQNITQSCLPSKYTVLVNGTTPGPELRLLEGKKYWIRVYNDMTDNNLTMVSSRNLFISKTEADLGIALAWALYGCVSIQRWHPPCKSMANPSTSFLRL